MSHELYAFLERASAFLILWSLGFTVLNTLRIAIRLGRRQPKSRDNAVLTELAGLPLTILQSVAFGMAVYYADWLSMLLFLWWGPGFVAVAILVVVARLRRRSIDWYPYRYPISYACKINYLAQMLVFFWHDMPGLIFAYSVWIINDQYEKALLSDDADRSRRTFDDGWLFRMMYPAGLLIPLFFAEIPWRGLSIVYGLALLALWIAGLIFVARRGAFFQLPEDPSLLRNMVYFGKLRVSGRGSIERVGQAVPDEIAT